MQIDTFIIILGSLWFMSLDILVFAKNQGILVQFAIGMGPKILLILARMNRAYADSDLLLVVMSAWLAGARIRQKFKTGVYAS